MDNKKNQHIGKLQLISAMLVFGSIGLFIRSIPFTSGQIALARGIIGTLFLFIIGICVQRSVSWERIKPNLKFLIPSGIAVGLNWIFLFQAYKYTTISIATICYYFAPVAVMFLSPILLKERLSAVKILCVLAAMGGMFCIVGIGGADGGSFVGILYGLGAAGFYATVMICNKFLKGISGMESSLVQLAVATVFLIPYVLFTDGTQVSGITAKAVVLLLIVGVIHTGLSYFLYFSAMQKLKGQTIAVLSYIDPVSAIFMAWIFLQETMSPVQIMGGLLVLGATLFNEVYENSRAST